MKLLVPLAPRYYIMPVKQLYENLKGAILAVNFTLLYLQGLNIEQYFHPKDIPHYCSIAIYDILIWGFFFTFINLLLYSSYFIVVS